MRTCGASRWTTASGCAPNPVDERVFDLATGQCLDDPAVRLPVHVVRVRDGIVEVALEAGAKASYRVDDASEIDESWLEGVSSVSVTSGASVPEDLVDGVLAFLAERGYPDARAVHTAEESLIFALPPELRRDIKAAELAQPPA